MHFTVMVVLPREPKNDADLDEMIGSLLAPFDESLEVAPYIDEDGDESTWNPQGEWDWWTLGGRWMGLWPPKATAACPTFTGRPGTFNNTPIFADGVDCLARGDVDDPRFIAERKHPRTHAVVAEGVWKADDWGHPWEGDDCEYTRWFETFWSKMPGDTFIALVDCHV